MGARTDRGRAVFVGAAYGVVEKVLMDEDLTSPMKEQETLPPVRAIAVQGEGNLTPPLRVWLSPRKARPSRGEWFSLLSRLTLLFKGEVRRRAVGGGEFRERMGPPLRGGVAGKPARLESGVAMDRVLK